MRRDKRERAAFAVAVVDDMAKDEEEALGDEDDQNDDKRVGVATAESEGLTGN